MTGERQAWATLRLKAAAHGLATTSSTSVIGSSSCDLSSPAARDRCIHFLAHAAREALLAFGTNLSSTLLSRKTALFCCQAVSHIVRLAAAKRYRSWWLSSAGIVTCLHSCAPGSNRSRGGANRERGTKKREGRRRGGGEGGGEEGCRP